MDNRLRTLYDLLIRDKGEVQIRTSLEAESIGFV